MNRRTFLASIVGLSFSPEILWGEELQLVDDWELSEVQWAKADKAKIEQVAPGTSNYYVYLSTYMAEGEHREALNNVLKVIVPSLCHKTSLKEQLPVQITPTLFRINLFSLGWLPFWHKILAKFYPYYPVYVGDPLRYYPLVIRADWFCVDLMNEVKTGDSQYQLLYAGKVPKNRDDFLKFWGVQDDLEYIYGMIEGKSGVAVNDPSGENSVRGIENRPSAKRGYFWITRDSKLIAGDTDFLEQIAKKQADVQHDASEYIVGIYKVYNQQEGCLQAYLLTDGNKILKKDARGKIIEQQKGNRQAEAPTDIVEEKNNINGRSIKNSQSCIFCHTNGIIEPTLNEYTKFIKDPTQLFLDEKSKAEVERFQGSDLQKYVKQNQEQYNDGVKMCCGLTAPEFSSAYSEVVRLYVGTVSLDSLAREMAMIYGPWLTTDQFQKALAFGSRYNILNLRTARIAENGTMTRNMVIENWSLFQKAIDLWRSKEKR